MIIRRKHRANPTSTRIISFLLKSNDVDLNALANLQQAVIAQRFLFHLPRVIFRSFLSFSFLFCQWLHLLAEFQKFESS